MQDLKKQFTLANAITVFMTVMLVLAVGIVLWTTNKGIDLSDEGLSLALANPDIANFDSVIRYDIIFKLIYRVTHWELGLIELRLLRITGLAVVLYFAFKNKDFKLSLIDKLLLALSLMAGYSILTESLSYYSLILFFSFFHIYFFLGSLKKGDFTVSLWAGVCIALAFMVKPPSAILLFGGTTGLLLLKSLFEKNASVIKYVVFATLGGLIIFVSFHFVFPEFSPIGVIRSGMELSNSDKGNYKGVSILFSLIASLKWVLFLVISGYLGAVFLTKRKTNFFIAALALLLSIGIIVFFFYKHYGSNEFDGLGYSAMVITSLIMGSFIVLGNVKEWPIEKKLLGIVLFASPFICQFGSNVYFFRSGVHYLVFWVLLLLLFKTNKEIQSMKMYFGLALSVLVARGAYANLIQHPIKQPEIIHANVQYTYHKDHTIYLNPAQASYLNQLKKVLHQHSNSDNKDYVIGMYCLPGHIVMTDMKVFYNPFIWNRQQLRFFVKKAGSHPQFSGVKPLILSETKEIENEIKDLYDVELLDSVKYFNNRYLYVFQTK